MPDNVKKEAAVLDNLALQIVDWLAALLPGFLVYRAIHSWEISVVVAWFFRLLVMLSRR